MSTPDRALVVLPTYDERDNIETITRAVLEADSRIDVLIVDDNSPDGTGKIADGLAADNARVHVLHRAEKRGLGRAYLAGFQWALDRPYDVVLEMDADLSHGPEYLPDFLREIEHYDLVIGSRYVSGVNVVNWSMQRLLLSYYANAYTRIVTGLPLRDATGGFKCFRREVLESINLGSVRSNGYSFQVEMSMRAWVKGFSIHEIPIVFVERAAGKSKMSNTIVREAIWMVPMLRLRALTGRLG